MQEGPLGGHLSALADRLLAYGYARPSIRRKLQLLADFSRWLRRKGVEAHELTPVHGRAFLLSRRRAGFRPHHGDRAAVAQALELLRQQGITAEPIPQPITTPIERLLKEYDF